MNEELTEVLTLKHSRLLRDIPYGFECSDGWFKLISELLDKVEEYDKDKIITLTQIKEKFATLRVYTSIDDKNLVDNGREDEYNKIWERLRDIISEAENKSAVTCELCGNTGKLSVMNGAWLRVMCSQCRKKTPGSKLAKVRK